MATVPTGCQVVAPPVPEKLTYATSVLGEEPPGSRRFVQVEVVARPGTAGRASKGVGRALVALLRLFWFEEAG